MKWLMKSLKYFDHSLLDSLDFLSLLLIASSYFLERDLSCVDSLKYHSIGNGFVNFTFQRLQINSGIFILFPLMRAILSRQKKLGTFLWNFRFSPRTGTFLIYQTELCNFPGIIRSFHLPPSLSHGNLEKIPDKPLLFAASVRALYKCEIEASSLGHNEIRIKKGRGK